MQCSRPSRSEHAWCTTRSTWWKTSAAMPGTCAGRNGTALRVTTSKSKSHQGGHGSGREGLPLVARSVSEASRNPIVIDEVRMAVPDQHGCDGAPLAGGLGLALGQKELETTDLRADRRLNRDKIAFMEQLQREVEEYQVDFEKYQSARAPGAPRAWRCAGARVGEELGHLRCGGAGGAPSADPTGEAL